jgi:hypothetical protein
MVSQSRLHSAPAIIGQQEDGLQTRATVCCRETGSFIIHEDRASRILFLKSVVLDRNPFCKRIVGFHLFLISGILLLRRPSTEHLSRALQNMEVSVCLAGEGVLMPPAVLVFEKADNYEEHEP